MAYAGHGVARWRIGLVSLEHFVSSARARARQLEHMQRVSRCGFARDGLPGAARDAGAGHAIVT